MHFILTFVSLVGAECPNPKQLVFGQTFFNLRDSLGKGAYKGLFGSGDEYVGDLEKDVRFVLESRCLFPQMQFPKVFVI